MGKTKKYSSDDILEWVAFLAKDPGQTPEALAGMRTLVNALKHFEHMTDNDIDFDHPLGRSGTGSTRLSQGMRHGCVLHVREPAQIAASRM
ncbi:MAG: hypothetical protein H7835_15240 [Magnetococcus sp. XQGC-1]